MNNDDIEKKLRALTGALHRPDPTPTWKADILARARLEASVADAIPMKRTFPPGWLVLSWAAAWVAILALNFTTPKDVASSAARGFAITHAPSTELSASPQTLLAFQRNMNLNLDLP